MDTFLAGIHMQISSFYVNFIKLLEAQFVDSSFNMYVLKEIIVEYILLSYCYRADTNIYNLTCQIYIYI